MTAPATDAEIKEIAERHASTRGYPYDHRHDLFEMADKHIPALLARITKDADARKRDRALMGETAQRMDELTTERDRALARIEADALERKRLEEALTQIAYKNQGLIGSELIDIGKRALTPRADAPPTLGPSSAEGERE